MAAPSAQIALSTPAVSGRIVPCQLRVMRNNNATRAATVMMKICRVSVR